MTCRFLETVLRPDESDAPIDLRRDLFHEKTLKKKYLISPYVFSLAMMCVVALLLPVCLPIYFYKDYIVICYNCYLSGGNWFTVNDVPAILLMFDSLALFLFIMIYVVQGYETLGVLHIRQDGLLLSALTRRRKLMRYEDIKVAYVDYGYLSLTKQFWIVFSTEPIPKKYYHNINRYCFSKKLLRIQYRRDVFDALVKQLPRDLGKRLERSGSTIRLHHADEE